MKPLLRWAGGKRHIAHLLCERFPSSWNSGSYFEPFLGGAALFLAINPNRAIVGDINANLVDFYLAVRDSTQEVLACIHKIRSKYNDLDEAGQQEFFTFLRSEFNDPETTYNKPALLFSLNKLCFNGLYRENSKGAFNVPFGKKRRFPEFSDAHFLEVSNALAHTQIMNADFEETVGSASAGDFVYFDPLYIPVNDTSNFTSYSSVGFGLPDQDRLASLMLSLKERGVNAVLSNSATNVTEGIYSGLRMERILAPRMVSAKASGRGSVEELIIMNF